MSVTTTTAVSHRKVPLSIAVQIQMILPHTAWAKIGASNLGGGGVWEIQGIRSDKQSGRGCLLLKGREIRHTDGLPLCGCKLDRLPGLHHLVVLQSFLLSVRQEIFLLPLRRLKQGTDKVTT